MHRIQCSFSNDKKLRASPLQLDSPSLDFTAQKFRIALKNRHIRAPKDPRILLQIPSLSPTSAPPTLDEEAATKPAGIKVGGVEMMRFKLPGKRALRRALRSSDFVLLYNWLQEFYFSILQKYSLQFSHWPSLIYCLAVQVLVQAFQYWRKQKEEWRRGEKKVQDRYLHI